ncbi:FxSxx-COOH system tetratricopeptide repeat protein [Amycolatopsis sp. H20-H5]|uniref:FxSxx-COOH system tetratricopeptide repeat protein n=1 Tax=Amycolatopsis sp. H20-H5 TaxID=3046309 RepID=UPI002DB7264A|nr:FxSxx-COOH system tetratricopeptide repeat protein [Amycolatopsis sp. H20-H5]MEC3977827.1 FxSxx-COOH system tetratricopeptide repeat protein [Amycolatopsis sp. H20-H5]
MGSSAGAGRPDPFSGAETRTGPPLADASAIKDLIWSELADAVWLASVTGEVRPEPEPPEPTPPQPEQSRTANGQSLEPAPEPGSPPVAEDGGRPVRESADVLGEPTPAEPDLLPLGKTSTHNGETLHLIVDEPGPLPASPVPFLVGARGILRALRPFKRKIFSLREEDQQLDEEATAEQAVQDGLWLPMTKAVKSRWLDLTVVVDTGPSMALWKPTVTAFLALLQQLGAFRTIGIRLLGTGEDGGPTLRGGTPDTPPRGPDELLDPSGRRLVLVLTDGVGEAWRRGLVAPLLARWGAVEPVAVLNLLPQRLWNRGGPPARRARLTVAAAMRPNRTYGLTLPDAWLEPDPAAAVPPGTVPIPVLELGERWLGWWARLVTGAHPDPVNATVLLAHQDPEVALGEYADEAETPQRSADERVRSFLSVASPPASRLARLLAAVPVTLPVARLVQAELMPESEPGHLAEVFTSGLLEAPVRAQPWDQAAFDFPELVREVLLGGARRSETARVIRVATRHFGGQSSVLTRMRDALDEPDSTPDPVLTRETAADVALERAVMRALSGPYVSRADRLHSIDNRAISAESSHVPKKSTITEPVSDTMSQAPDQADLAREAAPRPSSVPEPPEVRAETPLFRSSGLATLATTARHERQSADDAPPVWGAVPPRNPNFTGRRELLDQLGKRLNAGTTAVLPAALHGMGGIGKTQMAVEYVYRHLSDYDIVWWVQATEVTQIRTALTELAQHLRLPGCEEAITAVPAVREALRLGRPYRRWLLIFDSAESPDLVRPFFPVNGSGEILVTSRNPDWSGIARPLELEVFQREESKELLRLRGPEIGDDDADQLAEKLGDLPLAIEQAAAWRAETGMPVQEYLRLFDEKVTEILDTSAPSDYELSVAAAWNVSFDELKTRSPAAHHLLQVCAFFAPEPITRSLFTGVRGVSVSPELDTALRDPMRLSRAIRDINRYGLAKIDHRSDTILLHRLVQLVLRNRMTAQHRADMRHGAHMLLANLDPNDPTSMKQWPRYLEVLPHVYASELIDCDDRWVRQLVINLLRFLYHWGDHQGALILARRAVEAWSERLGEADSQTLQAAERLGFYLWTLGEYAEAREINTRTLRLYKETIGDDREETLNAQLTVAVDLKAGGDFAAALELNSQTYLKSRALFGEEDPATLNSAHDYLISLLLTGDYGKTRELGEATYDRRVQVLGYDNASSISTLVALLLARRELGDYHWARVEQEKVSERARELLGEDRAFTLLCYHFLAVARRKDGDHQTALDVSREALDRFRLRYGEQHPNAMACALAHSIDIRHSGDLPNAHKLGEHVFDLYRHSLGEQHAHTLSAALDLGVTLRLMGDPAAALRLDERSLEQFRTRLGPDHPHAIVCAIDVASDRFALGAAESAQTLDTDILARAQRVLGEDHPTTLAAQTNLAVDLRELGRTREAETLHADAVTRYRRVLGDTHPGTIAAVGGLRSDCDIDPMPL